MPSELYIVGDNPPDREPWEVVGVFDSKELAESHCTTPYHFVGPKNLNVAENNPAVPWPGAYYPLAEKQEA
jgi:hypothetical protein